ncbi:hypothetical protein F5B20DRAFT_578255 [Whalleya microplaca]|nr:hypothetical protein F5B20DRAFT_578255 [Whalleya microplaca]
MNIARVTSWGSPPEYRSGPSLPPPSPSELQLKVVAVGVPRLVQGRATGTHSSAMGASLPFDPSVDGVGLDETTGHLYYIGPTSAPLFAERANVDRSRLVRLKPGADPVAVAALVNPVGSSWMALRRRALGGCEGKTVLVLGATGASGRAAVHVACLLGAARIVGVSRNADKLAAVEGLDERVQLRDPLLLPKSVGPVHIVLDFVGGRAAVGVMQSAEVPPGEDLQYIYVGDLAGQNDIVLPARLLNMKPVRIAGSGIGSWSKTDVEKELAELVAVATKLKRPHNVWTASLADVRSVWDTEDAKTKRLVLVP